MKFNSLKHDMNKVLKSHVILLTITPALSGSHDMRPYVILFKKKFSTIIWKCFCLIFQIKMLTDRSPLLCHFSKLVNFNPISLVHLPKSLITKSFSGDNLYISQNLAKSFSINMNRKTSSSTSKDRLFSIEEAFAMV